jgi:Bacterial Ig-like domain (group 2)
MAPVIVSFHPIKTLWLTNIASVIPSADVEGHWNPIRPSLGLSAELVVPKRKTGVAKEVNLMKLAITILATVMLLGCSSPAPPAAALKSIAVTPASTTISVGSTQQYTAVGTYTNGSSQITSGVVWSSFAPADASITSGGLATGLAPGSTKITAALGNIVSPPAELTVSAIPVIAISLSCTGCANGAVTISPGGKLAITATVTNDPTNSGVVWEPVSVGSVSNETSTSVTYTAPASSMLLNETTVVGLTAESVADPSVSASLDITIVFPLENLTGTWQFKFTDTAGESETIMADLVLDSACTTSAAQCYVPSNLPIAWSSTTFCETTMASDFAITSFTLHENAAFEAPGVVPTPIAVASNNGFSISGPGSLTSATTMTGNWMLTGGPFPVCGGTWSATQ